MVSWLKKELSFNQILFKKTRVKVSIFNFYVSCCLHPSLLNGSVGSKTGGGKNGS